MNSPLRFILPVAIILGNAQHDFVSVALTICGLALLWVMA